MRVSGSQRGAIRLYTAGNSTLVRVLNLSTVFFVNGLSYRVVGRSIDGDPAYTWINFTPDDLIATPAANVTIRVLADSSNNGGAMMLGLSMMQQVAALVTSTITSTMDATMRAVVDRIDDVTQAVSMTCDADTSKDVQSVSLPKARLQVIDSLRRGAPDLYKALLAAADQSWEAANDPKRRKAACLASASQLAQAVGASLPAASSTAQAAAP
jgi:hypothetical protein